MSHTITLTDEQRAALRLALPSIQFAWAHRAEVLRQFVPATSVEIRARIKALEEIDRLLYSPQPARGPYDDDKFSRLNDEASAERRLWARQDEESRL